MVNSFEQFCEEIHCFAANGKCYKCNSDRGSDCYNEAIVLSMTPYERRHPEILKASRKQRIAKGSGRSVEEVNRLLKQFEEMKQMMKHLKNGNMKLPF